MSTLQEQRQNYKAARQRLFAGKILSSEKEIESEASERRSKAFVRSVLTADEAAALERQKIRRQNELMAARLEAMRAMLSAPPKIDAPPAFADIVKVVCRYYDISREHLFSQRRAVHLAMPRMLLMWLAHEDTGLSYTQIGRLTGGRDHTTAMHAVRRIGNLLSGADKPLAKWRVMRGSVNNLAADIKAIRAQLGIRA
jgi:chromosomal replication initiation ATPase DnaA